MISFPNRFLLFLLLFTACQTQKIRTAEQLIAQSVSTYGFDAERYQINFDFRNYSYELEREQGYFSYTRQTIKEGKKILDLMTSEEKLKRFQDDSLVSIQDSIQKVYSNSLNSVMYFFQLPKPLQDPAVNPELLSSVEIKGTSYWTLKITFDQEGGGEDFQDEFRYWINQENNQIDYLAYNYLTDGGGTRFRVAKNAKKIKGFLFQDYDNYKPQEKWTPLDSLPALYDTEILVKISTIENKNIVVKIP